MPYTSKCPNSGALVFHKTEEEVKVEQQGEDIEVLKQQIANLEALVGVKATETQVMEEIPAEAPVEKEVTKVAPAKKSTQTTTKEVTK